MDDHPTAEAHPMPTKADRRALVDVLARHAASPGETRRVQLLRPFAVLSKNTYSAPVQPPIGVAYLAALVERAGYPVGIIDAIGEDILRIEPSADGSCNLQGLPTEAILARIAPDTAILGVSLMFSLEWLQQRDLIRRIRQAFPELIIVAGGEHVTALAEYLLADCPEIDYLVAGEGDVTLLHLVHHLFHRLPVDDIQGLVFRRPDGAVVNNGLGARIANVDQLPYPAWHLLPVTNYFIDNWTGGIATGRNMIIMATRGCPYQCTFCSNPGMWTTRYQMRDPGGVLDEIQWLIDTYQASSIDFCDLTAIVKKDWVLDFCRQMKARGMRFTWQLPSGTRSEAMDKDVLQAIFDAGCRLVVLAPESGSERTLKTIKKKISLARITDSIRQAVRIGHTVKVNLVIGFPEERYSDVLKTFFYAIRCALIGADDCNIAIFTPYPGSEIFHDLRRRGIIARIDDAYFHNLLIQFDMTSTACYADHVPGWFLALVRLVGQSLFYSLAYLTRPRRLVRLVASMRAEKFHAHNLFEQRIHDFVVRRRLNSQVRPEGRRAGP